MTQELTRFLHQFPNIQTLELLTSDLNGMIRGKRIERPMFEKVFSDGVALPGSLYALDATGSTVEETGLGLETGDSDRVCYPVAGTLSITPWHQDRAQAIISMFEQDGTTPFCADPRHVLEQQLNVFATLGLQPVVAVELEFYLVDRKRDANNGLQPPQSLNTGRRMNTTQCYSMEDLDNHDAFIQRTLAMARAQNLPADGVVAEYAPGQFEVNLHHCHDPLQAADHALMLKRIIRHAAREFDFEATFMAKPYIDQSGSGTHVHLSLIDAHGQPLFAGADAETHSPLRHAIGGLLATADATQALLFPTINSYRRLTSGDFAPHAKTWAFDNRTVALRIPSGDPENFRVEHRVAGADVNPYLAVAVVLAGVYHGLQQQIDPGAPVVGNAYEQDHPTLADNPRDALRAFAESDWLKAQFNPEFLRIYEACKWHETQLFEQQVTAMELDLLLPYL